MYLPLMLLLALAQDNEGEKAYRAAEKMIVEAETAQITVNVVVKGSKGEMTLKETILMAKGNKVRRDMTVHLTDKPFKTSTVSDGTKLKFEASNGDGGEVDTPMSLNAKMTEGLCLTGVSMGMFAASIRDGGPTQNSAVLTDVMKASEFVMGKKEKLGDRQAQRIDYKLSLTISTTKKKGRQIVAVTIWLDRETNLLLKRVINANTDDESKSLSITENYDIRLNTKIEASKFQLQQ